LIKKGKAFVCKLTKDEGKVVRDALEPSPYRDTSVEENLIEFNKMKIGFYAEGVCVLRAKIDYKNANPTLRDPIIYRVLYTDHPAAGDKWCIYPMYDFAHGVGDSIENITHSCCTKEFEIRRDLYYWFLIELDLYRPYVYEFSRLNMTYTFLSKRKVTKLIKENIISGYDDPRLYTVMGMKRRGITSDTINSFCDHIGVTRSNNDTVVQVENLECHIRKDMDKHAERTLACLRPVKLIIEDMKDDETVSCKGLKWPGNADRVNETYDITLTKEVWVDEIDVREDGPKEFWGICPGRTVRLKYGPVIQINFGSFTKDENGNVIEVRASRVDAEKDAKSKPKGVLGWVSKADALKVEVRNYEHLFNVEMPDDKDFIGQVNHDSKIVFKSAIVNKCLLSDLKVYSRFQFERLGFYTVDEDSNFEKSEIVFNLTIGVDDKSKKKALK